MLTFLIGFLLGTVLGSLILCLADRTINHQTFLGRSHCDSCHKNLGFLELLPVISFFLWRGKCRHCKTRLSLWYPVSEILIGVVMGYIFWQSLPNDFVFN